MYQVICNHRLQHVSGRKNISDRTIELPDVKDVVNFFHVIFEAWRPVPSTSITFFWNDIKEDGPEAQWIGSAERFQSSDDLMMHVLNCAFYETTLGFAMIIKNDGHEYEYLIDNIQE